MRELRIADVTEDSIVDGPGLRMTVFTQGCPHRCRGCHNPTTHDADGGQSVTVDALLARLDDNPLEDGITLSGGEPFMQAEACAILAEETKKRHQSVVTYTGYTLETLREGFSEHPEWERLLRATDLLVDGPFLLEERSLALKWRGSKNQRLIDMQKTIANGYETVLWQD